MTTIDTIVATATAPGRGAVAVLRLSGPDAWPIARSLLGGEPLPGPGTLGVRWVHHPGTGERVDQVVASAYAGPKSYTGEDVVEMSGHGGPLAPALLLEACVAAGARVAEPGEFTRRAYLNGKIDLIQAEAVLDVVEGRSPALHEVALRDLDRGLSSRLAALRERLIGLEVLLVHHIDFPDEDEPPVPLQRIVEAGASVTDDLDRLLASAPEGELLRDGVWVVLAGAPNSGKSTLFNALIGSERAIVTDTPGTTRDAIEAHVSIGGFPFHLVDTAGIRPDPEEIERMGIEVAERYLARADLVLFCRDAGEALSDGADGGTGAAVLERFLSRVTAPIQPLWTKVDGTTAPPGESPLTVDPPSRDSPGGGDGRGASILAPLAVSARTGEGLGSLRERLPRLAFRGLVEATHEEPLLTRRRHIDAVRIAATEVRAFTDALRDGVPAEVAATHLRPAETALEGLLGVIPRDEILDVVFREFCIGK